MTLYRPWVFTARSTRVHTDRHTPNNRLGSLLSIQAHVYTFPKGTVWSLLLHYRSLHRGCSKMIISKIVWVRGIIYIIHLGRYKQDERKFYFLNSI